MYDLVDVLAVVTPVLDAIAVPKGTAEITAPFSVNTGERTQAWVSPWGHT